MSDVSCFPKNSDEALAFLYVQRSAPGDATPEDLRDLYDDAFKRIDAKRRENKKLNMKSLI